MPYFEVIKLLIARYPERYIKIMEIAEELTMTKPNGISLPPGTFEKLILDKLSAPNETSPTTPNYVIPDNPFCSGGAVYLPRNDPWW